MSRQLLVLRHAKSAWDTGASLDFDRPLAGRGRKDAPRVGQRLRRDGVIPDGVLSSPAARARETTLEVCRELGIHKDEVIWEPRIYGGNANSLVEVLRGCKNSIGTVMMVGHNPGLVGLLEYLCGPDLPNPSDGKLLTTAAVAHLHIPVNWHELKPESARLLSITRPRPPRHSRS
ncbi:MAG: histidine phosphatase family protein [Proteobacteria bacterium]|jgi:phosphohistidine phosphatase|nr:histidine phosphatase family protein [Pseudomonadota bacterium]MDA1302410.1 histidine phosphatase family protein [Pseudomonadota bacterium]